MSVEKKCKHAGECGNKNPSHSSAPHFEKLKLGQDSLGDFVLFFSF